MDQPASTILDVVDDPEFCALMGFLHQDILSWDRFLSRPLPKGMSPLTAWEAINKISRCIGIELLPTIDGTMMWYRRIYELDGLVGDIAGHSSKGSRLYRILLSDADEALKADMRIEEACSCASAAGIAQDRDQLKLLFHSGAAPMEAQETIVANMIALDAELSQHLDTPFSLSLLDFFHTLLVSGVEESGLKRLTYENGDDPIDEETWSNTLNQLEHTLEYANRSEERPVDSPVLSGTLIRDTISYYRPYGTLSPFVASLAAKLYYLKHGFPVLALLPLTTEKVLWMNGELDEAGLCCSIADYTSTLARCLGDITFHQMVTGELIMATIRKSEAVLHESIDQSEIINRIIHTEPALNHRQRSILVRMLMVPQAEFRISYHKTKHSISYSTARRDLVELERKGYLISKRTGKEFVFFADSDNERLMQGDYCVAA